VVVAFGASYLREVTLPDVQLWADTLTAEGLAPSTCGTSFIAMRSSYAWALPHGMATANPTAGLRLPLARRSATGSSGPPRESTRLACADDRGCGERHGSIDRPERRISLHEAVR
jgi:hypothetical protein